MYNKALILGAARSGIAAAKLLQISGTKSITINDSKERAACLELMETEALGITSICGSHPDYLLSPDLDVIVKNPGIRYDLGIIQEAIKMNIPVVTEVEIASQFCKAPIIGITGTNGKTTTTSLISAMLHESKIDSITAGNIGTALCDVVLDLNRDQWLVAELSSFQLKGTLRFKPRIAICLNLVPAHLDYHKNIEDYSESKLKIFANQDKEDIAILNFDSSYCRELGHNIGAGKIIWFSRSQELETGFFINKDGYVVSRGFEREDYRFIHIDEVGLKGEFNLENLLAAFAVADIVGCNKESILKVARTFSGVEHRLEYVTELEGVKYYNDSKATNMVAANQALQAFSEPIIWLAGGLDRGDDFRELSSTLQKHVRATIAYGQSAPALAQASCEAGVDTVRVCASFLEAVETARNEAQSGEIILLSPACASWDMFSSFEERGNTFKEAILNKSGISGQALHKI